MALNGLSDELLLGRAKNGSAECFSEIYGRHESGCIDLSVRCVAATQWPRN